MHKWLTLSWLVTQYCVIINYHWIIAISIQRWNSETFLRAILTNLEGMLPCTGTYVRCIVLYLIDMLRVNSQMIRLMNFLATPIELWLLIGFPALLFSGTSAEVVRVSSAHILTLHRIVLGGVRDVDVPTKNACQSRSLELVIEP